MSVLVSKIKSNYPWRRFFARFVDYYIFYWIVDEILSNVNLDTDGFYISLITLFLYIPVEASMLTLLTTTPGKFFFGLTVQMLDGDRVTFYAALKRSFLVLLKGLALGVPIVDLVLMQIAFARLKDTGSTSWDEEVGTEVVKMRARW
jgi:uncharacterized RDD family membrane protein YckC